MLLMAGIDWAKALDLALAAKNVRDEFVGDWYRDPWGWPELEYMIKTSPQLVLDNLGSSGARRAAQLKVPKENWGVRPAVVLDIVDRISYQALIDRLSVDLIGDLPPSVYGWRLMPANPSRGDYSHNNIQWDAYRGHLAAASMHYECALVTDVVSCFASIQMDTVRDAVDDRAPKGAVATRLISFLDGFEKIPERSGLPQRSVASAVLANMVLGPLDDVLEHHALDVPILAFLGSRGRRRRRRRSWTRWMDDMWLFGNDPAIMRRAQTELQDVATTLGLHINSGKTEVLEDEEVASRALEIEHSAIDGSLSSKKDPRPLEELIDRLLENPETASRTSLKFAVSRMQDHGQTYRILEFPKLAERMPHVADSLAKLFEASFTRGSLQDWFIGYAKGPWASFEWSVAQYLQMFPSSDRPRKQIRNFASSVVDDSDTSLPLVSVAAQRLSSWDPGEARAVIRGAIPRSDHPQRRRVLAVAALAAGESRSTVRRWLQQEPENHVTLAMMEHHNFAVPKVVYER
jgi:hypothetical protein